MEMTKRVPERLDDTIWIVLDVPTERLRDIADHVSGMVDPKATRILELAGVEPSA